MPKLTGPHSVCDQVNPKPPSKPPQSRSSQVRRTVCYAEFLFVHNYFFICIQVQWLCRNISDFGSGSSNSFCICKAQIRWLCGNFFRFTQMKASVSFSSCGLLSFLYRDRKVFNTSALYGRKCDNMGETDHDARPKAERLHHVIVLSNQKEFVSKKHKLSVSAFPHLLSPPLPPRFLCMHVSLPRPRTTWAIVCP